MEFLTKNSWTLKLNKLPAYVEWNGDWNYSIDAELIRLILNCNEVDELGNPKITEKMKTSFKKNIVDNMRKGKLYIKWTARRGNLGRRYSAPDPDDTDPFSSAGSLGVHSKYIKNTIFHYEGWVDYDMVKGHSTLILNMARHTKLTDGLPAVQRFVDDFDNGLAECLIQHYSIGDIPLTKGDIKDLHNRTIYGGGHAKWVESMRMGDEKKGKVPKECNDVEHPYYTEFRNEVCKVIDLVYDNNPELVAKVCVNPPAPKPPLTLWDRKKRTMSYFCGILENECLKHAYKYGLENGLFKARTIDLCFDGFTAPPPPPYTDMDFHINGMNEYIYEKTGFNIKMKVKPFIPSNLDDKCYVIQSIIDERRSLVQAELAPVMAEVVVDGDVAEGLSINNDDEYIDWKEKFEKEWCKIKNTATFMRTYKKNGVFDRFIFQDKKKLVIAYENECYTKTTDDGKQKTIVYINEWLKDPNQLVYEDAGVYPPPMDCPENEFNLWKDSPYEAQPFTDENDPDIDGDAVGKFITHIDIMCNRDAMTTEWLCSWFAHALQKPCEKPEHAINLIGKEGTGKSTIINTFSKLLGAGKVLETQQPERDVWGSFNSVMTNTYLVVLSETDKRNSMNADGKIKALITDYPMVINPKGKDQFNITSFHRVIQLTNTTDPTKTSKDDRRNFIIRCSDELKNNTQYFDELREALARPNALRSIYWSFKKFDISNWNFRNVPKTEYHNTIIEHNKNPILLFLESFVLNHRKEQEVKKTGTELLAEFRVWRDETGYKFSDGMNEGVLIKKIKLECDLPKDAIVAGKRTKKGILQTFNISILKKHFGLISFKHKEKRLVELIIEDDDDVDENVVEEKKGEIENYDENDEEDMALDEEDD